MEILTVKDVSKILHKGINQTYNLFNSKAFPSFKIGRRMYITKEAFTGWLKRIEGKTIQL